MIEKSGEVFLRESDSWDTRPNLLRKLFQKLLDNPIATIASKLKRAEFEAGADTSIREFHSRRNDMEMVIVLAGSVQTGMASNESDIDKIYYLLKKNGKLIDKKEQGWNNLRLDLFLTTDSSIWQDFGLIKQQLSQGPYYQSNDLDSLLPVDQTTDKYWQKASIGTESEDLRQYSTKVSGAVPYEKLIVVAALFSPTTPKQEEGDIIHKWREEILKIIADRPDKYIFWDAVCRCWLAQFVLIEQNTISLKNRLDRYQLVLKRVMEGRLNRTLGEQEFEKRANKMERHRNKVKLPDLDALLVEFGI